MIGSPVLSYVNFFHTVGIVLNLQYKSEIIFITYCMKIHSMHEILFRKFKLLYFQGGDRGSTVVKVLCYKSEGPWFNPSWCQWIFHSRENLPIALWP